MQGKTSIFSLTAIGLFLLLCCCKQPIQPVVEPPLNFDEPDTIKSFVSFILDAPTRRVYKWQLTTPADTFSNGAITSTGVVTRPDIWLLGGASFGHSLKSQYCSFKCFQSFDLVMHDYIHPHDGRLDAIRSSSIERLYFSFRLSRYIPPLPSKQDSLLTFSWSDKRYQERFVTNSTPGTWSVQSFVVDVFADIEFSPHYINSIDTMLLSPLDLNRYRARIERAEFYLDRYDTVRQRADGRFSFRAVGYNNTIVDIKDGRFTNVKLYRFRE